MSTVEVHDPRSDPEPVGWKRFTKRARLLPVWDYRLLGIEAWLARNPPVLAVVRDGDDVLGAFVAMVCRTVRDRAYAPPPGKARRGLTPRWVEVYLPALSGYSACVFLSAVDDGQRREAVREFERVMVERLGPGLLGIVYRAMDADLGPVLSGRGRATREIDPAAVLTGVESAQAWEEALPDAARERLGAAASLRVESGYSRTDLDGRELATLLNDHRARQDARAWADGQRSRVGGLHLDTRSRIAPAYLDALLGRRDVVTTTWHGEDGLVAFSVLLDHTEGAALQHFAARPGSGLWVDAYARAVRHTAEHRRPLLTAGRTLLEQKAALGFDSRPLVSVAVPRPFLGRQGKKAG